MFYKNNSGAMFSRQVGAGGDKGGPQGKREKGFILFPHCCAEKYERTEGKHNSSNMATPQEHVVEV